MNATIKGITLLLALIMMACGGKKESKKDEGFSAECFREKSTCCEW